MHNVERDRLREVVESITDLVSAYDHDWRYVYVNAACADLLRDLGTEPEACLGRSVWALFPETVDTPFYHYMLRAAAEQRPVYFEEYLAPVDRWLDHRIFPSAGGVVAIARDVTARKRQEEALALSERRFRSLVEAAAQVVWITDADGNIVGDIPEWAEITGQLTARAQGLGMLDAVHPQHRAAVERLWREAVATAQPFRATFLLRVDDGSYCWYHARGLPVRDASGAVREWVGTSTDIDAQKRREDAAHLLSDASSLLASSIDLERTLHNVAELAVPTFGDACAVYLLEPDGAVRRLALSSVESRMLELFREGDERRPLQATQRNIVSQVIRSSQPMLVPQMTEEMLALAVPDAQHLGELREFVGASVIVAPMIGREGVLGALLFANHSSRRRYGDSDLWVAEELARRSALAIDSARLYQAALAANQAKSDFLATMSHELRTPLSAIIGYNELLADGISGPVNEMQKEQLGRIKTSALHLLGLIEEVLSYARIEAGRERIHRESAELGVVVEQVASMIAPLAASRGLRFTVTAPDRGVRLETDIGKLRQILVNLLSNAVKFTAEGDVALTIRPSGRSVECEVRDSGVGIAAADLPRIWEPFTQLDQRPTRLASGTGLGLSVTRRLVALLGGEIQVESEVGVGTRFVVTLPAVLERRAGEERAPRGERVG